MDYWGSAVMGTLNASYSVAAPESLAIHFHSVWSTSVDLASSRAVDRVSKSHIHPAGRDLHM